MYESMYAGHKSRYCVLASRKEWNDGKVNQMDYTHVVDWKYGISRSN